ncbi:MAG TPA: stage V sporulation protein T [Clostridiales bacterium]|nr:stage V sporulation protein T [Clostridiales bacterium]
MKATGIVRRIDELGRVVIPKEIRRTLRIREGDPLEIYTDKDGEVILKKYSPMSGLSDFAAQYAESLSKTSGHVVCIADRDSIIAASGPMRKELLEKSLSKDMEKVMEERSTVLVKSGSDKVYQIVMDENSEKRYTSQVISTIVSEGDPIGAVIILSTDPSVKMGDVESKLAQSAANLIGRQMEQ